MFRGGAWDDLWETIVANIFINCYNFKYVNKKLDVKIGIKVYINSRAFLYYPVVSLFILQFNTTEKSTKTASSWYHHILGSGWHQYQPQIWSSFGRTCSFQDIKKLLHAIQHSLCCCERGAGQDSINNSQLSKPLC